MKIHTLFFLPLSLIVSSLPVYSQISLSSGYTIGSDVLLTTGGGSGSELFADFGAGGGVDLVVNGGSASWLTGLLDGSSFWNIGDTVTITGIALPIHENTANGTFTFEIREGVGTGNNGLEGTSPIGSTTATFSGSGLGTAVNYVNFETPVTFVVDANSASIGINVSNTGSITLKANNAPGLQRFNYSNGNIPGSNAYFRWSVAGTVTPVPEPSTFAILAGLGALGFVIIHRRRKA